MNQTTLKITAGAGGAESQGWAAMLLKMYLRWIAWREFSVAPGRIVKRTRAGIQSAELVVRGDDVARLLSVEAGVHRLVRISPFDDQKRRHTSFASVVVDDRWGAGQVRSYVLHPYTLVKDLRTSLERTDIEAVLDGDIDGFVEAALAQGLPYQRDPDGPVAELAAVMD